MSKFLHDKAVVIPWVFSENIRAKNEVPAAKHWKMILVLFGFFFFFWVEGQALF